MRIKMIGNRKALRISKIKLKKKETMKLNETDWNN